MTLTEAIHLEPLTELALKRYTLSEVDGGYKLEALQETAVKDVQFIVDLINVYSDPESFKTDVFESYSMSIILDYLKKTHAFYTDRLLPKMEMAVKSLQDTFEDHPIAQVLDRFFTHYRNEFLEHIELEERRLFPYASTLYDGLISYDYSVQEFTSHHNHDLEDHLQDVLYMIESEFPEVARSFAYRSFSILLEQFRADLRIHHLIEEHVFLLKVKNLESTLGHA